MAKATMNTRLDDVEKRLEELSQTINGLRVSPEAAVSVPFPSLAKLYMFAQANQMTIPQLLTALANGIENAVVTRQQEEET